MENHEFEALVSKVNSSAKVELEKLFNDYKGKTAEMAAELVKNGGYISKEAYEEHKGAVDKLYEKLNNVALEQGKSILEMQESIRAGSGNASKTLEQILKDHEGDLRKCYDAGVGTVQFLMQPKASGSGFIVRKIDTRTAKAAGVTATIDNAGGGGGTASVDQDLLSSSLLRVGGTAPIINNFRNTPWLFDLVNVVNAEFVSGNPFAMYWEEQAKEGSPAQVAEGSSKPLVQYLYALKSAEYKKIAQLVTFTEEFSIDFRRLQDDILNKGRVDVLNAVNTAVLTNVLSNATAYNTAADFVAGDGVEFVNDFDAIAAMAAQVEDSTYGIQANAAIMSTFKKYRMGISKADTGEYLNRPDVLAPISFVGNPDMAADAVVVGDLRNYNVILRGGVLVKIGYNGTDFAENKFSVVTEQYYYDYISTIRKSAIVKGPTFQVVKNAIGAQANS